MNFHFDNWLVNKLKSIQETLQISDYVFKVVDEQYFLDTSNSPEPNHVYIVVKYTTDSKSVNSTIQPLQVLIMCEQNSQERTMLIFSKLAEDENWTSLYNSADKIFVKFQFTRPVVLSNFNEIGYGYRSIIYLTANLYIMENALDIQSISIQTGSMTDPLVLDCISTTIAYSMSPNTQLQGTSEYIASSVKAVSTFSMSLTIPFLDNDITTSILNIISGTGTGNETFTIRYTITGKSAVAVNMKLISVSLGSAKDNLPVLQIGFIK